MNSNLLGAAMDRNSAFGDVMMLVGGRWVPSADGGWMEVTSPGHADRVIARVPAATAVDVEAAVESACRAQAPWGALHFAERARRLSAIADEVEAHLEPLARLTALDTGNAIRTQARPEVLTLVSLFRYFAGVAAEMKGVVLPAGAGQLQFSSREPLGVVGAILPWNSPLMIAGMKIPPALAAGNAIVVKASELAPLSVLYLAELAARHLPAGLLQVLTGDGKACGAPLVRHPAVAKVSFTGSTSVGAEVAGVAASRFAHLSLELGGKSPSIVWPDSMNDETVLGAMSALRITRQGQSCTAGTRLFVHASIYEDFLTRLAEALGALKVGDPLAEETDMGSLINRRQYERVSAYIQEGRGHPTVITMLDGIHHAQLGDGYYMGPTLFAGADNKWRLAQEEIFGPVLVAIPWSNDDEVIEMANDSHYGLAAYLWCHDLDRALGAARRIDSGWIQINQGTGQVVGQAYGGYKQSGIGREFSMEGALEAFTQTKQINVQLATPARAR